MLYALLSILICTIIAAGMYYSAYHYVKLKHNREVIADELQRSVVHIEELEARIAMMESQRDLQEYKSKPKEDETGWNTFATRR